MLAVSVLMLTLAVVSGPDEPTPAPTPTALPTEAKPGRATPTPTARPTPPSVREIKELYRANPGTIGSAGRGLRPLASVTPGARITDADVGHHVDTALDSEKQMAVSDVWIQFDKKLAGEHCKKEWPDDFRMEAYCLTRQSEAVEDLARRTAAPPIPPDAFVQARKKCRTEWWGNYEMQNYCEGKQIEGYKQLHPEK